MKKSLIMVLMLGLVMFSGCKKTSIAKVDINLVMKQYTMILEANKTLTAEGSALENQSRKSINEINDLKQEIAMLEGDAKAKKEELLKRKTDQLRTNMGKNRTLMQQKRNDLMVKAFAKIKAVLERKAKDAGYDVVLDTRPVFYSSENVVDITSEVIGILNAEYAISSSQGSVQDAAVSEVAVPEVSVPEVAETQEVVEEKATEAKAEATKSE